jgi:hypothetical protein
VNIKLLPRPVMAILVNRRFIGSLGNLFAPDEALYYLRSAAAEGISAYFCSVDDIHPSDRTVFGWSEQLPGFLVRTSVPWPDFFYDQGKDMDKDERALADRLRSELIGMIKPVNSQRFLDKWLLHQALRRFRRMRHLLPDTRLGWQPGHLRAMLRRHRAVIAKPTNSSRGRGISLITMRGRRGYTVESAKGEVVECSDLQSAFQQVLSNARRTRVLLQQRLPLLAANGRLFDLRLLMEKNSAGQWILVSPRLRLGREGRIITNTNKGADRLPLLYHLTNILGESAANRISTKAEQLAIMVCRHIERVVGPMGEIGLDFIVDDAHRLWFIEGNPQPGKTPMPEELIGNTPLLYRHVMSYCAHLWRQQNRLQRTTRRS